MNAMHYKLPHASSKPTGLRRLLLPFLVLAVSTFAAGEENFYRITKECKNVMLYIELDEDAVIEGMVAEVGDVYPLRIDKQHVLGLKFGPCAFAVKRADCELVPSSEHASAIANYQRNLQINQKIVKFLEDRSRLVAPYQADHESLETVETYASLSFMFYQDMVKEIQGGKISKQKALLELEKNFADSLAKINDALVSIRGKEAKQIAQAVIKSLSGARALIQSVYDYNEEQTTNAQKAIGKSALSALLGNPKGALEIFGHAMIDEGADWAAFKRKNLNEDHWEDLRQAILRLNHILGQRIPSCFMTEEEELDGRYEWRLVD